MDAYLSLVIPCVSHLQEVSHNLHVVFAIFQEGHVGCVLHSYPFDLLDETNERRVDPIRRCISNAVDDEYGHADLRELVHDCPPLREFTPVS